MEQPNKLMTWEEMVENYPGKWVIVKKQKAIFPLLKKE